MQFDPRLILLAQRHAEALGISHLALPSGAFHDALHLARHAPSAMLFAPSRGGISHHGDEDTDPADLASCARVLAASLAELADQPSFQREPP
jgi:N-carbamoyl-L-amino-acid hydrolase